MARGVNGVDTTHVLALVEAEKRSKDEFVINQRLTMAGSPVLVLILRKVTATQINAQVRSLSTAKEQKGV